MAFEERNGREYYYKKKRIGKKVVFEYIGGGEFGSLCAEIDEQIRLEETAKAEKRKRERAQIEKVDRKLNDLERQANLMVAEFLESLGFTKGSNNEWRLKNEK